MAKFCSRLNNFPSSHFASRCRTAFHALVVRTRPRPRVRARLASVPVGRPAEFPLGEVVAASSLDAAQAAALKAVLCQEVAVVQGPPGTGKTYLSIQATRLILANTAGSGPAGGPTLGLKPTIGPLLVVTFTNHALDQYMEGLLDVGCTDVVRVGGGSKNPRLEPYNLNKKLGEVPRIAAFWGTREQLQELQTEVLDLLEECRSNAEARRPQQLRRKAAAASYPCMSWTRLEEVLEHDGALYNLLRSFQSGRRRHNLVTDLVQEWLDGSPRSDLEMGRLGVSSPAPGGDGVGEDEVGSDGDWEDDEDEDDEAAGDQPSGRQGVEEPGAAGSAGEEAADPSGSGREQGDVDVGFGSGDPWVTDAGRQAEAEMERLFIDAAAQQEDGMLSQQEEHHQHQRFAAGYAGGLDLRALEASDRTLGELLQAKSVWTMSRLERWRLYRGIRDRRLSQLVQQIEDLQEQMRSAQKEEKVAYDNCKLTALRKTRVVVIVEEAAEVFEAHVLACLVRSVEHLVLIGDHEQLRPKANMYEMQAYSGKGLDLDVSLFERLFREGTHVSALQQQRRMRPQIADLVRGIYPALSDHPSVQAYPPVRGMVHNLFLWDHDHPDKGGSDEAGRSRTNPWEAEAAVRLARYLMQQSYAPEDIVILVPYVGQLMAVRRELTKRKIRVVISAEDAEQVAKQAGSEAEDEVAPSEVLGDGLREASGESIRVATVDNFQGEEARIIIVSATCSNADAYIGFLKMRNRVNVMLSRAQHGMYILANTSTLMSDSNTRKTPLWARVRELLERQGCIGTALQLRCERHGTISDIRSLRDFEVLAGDGGCNQPCGAILPCGHTCPRRCHTDDPDHERTRCTEPCDRLHSPCGHPCDKLCGEECGPCARVLSAHQLACGHVAIDVACALVTSGQVNCSQPTEVAMPECGHVLSVPCNEATRYLLSPRLCSEPVAVTMELCGHTCIVPCGDRREAPLQPNRCREPCGATLACFHECRGTCGGCATNRIAKAFRPLAEAVGYQIPGESTRDDTDEDAEPETGDGAWKGEMAARLGRRQGKATAAAAAGGSARQPIAGSSRGGPPRPAAVRKAGALVSHAQKAGRVSYLKAQLERLQEGHAPCGELCGRHLACGHYCASSCHRGRPCPACEEPCWIACEHHVCRKACGQPCVPCAGSCSWSCVHQGSCGAPCGAPCDRLPCDERCSKLLSCGHRCPGLCGEPCPTADYCVHPDCRGKAPERIREQVVDYVLLRTFGELDDEDVSADPLVPLRCGHVYTASSLDGHLRLEERFYLRGPPGADGRPGPWLGLRPLPDDQDVVKGCPDCRAPIQGVRRYGRATRKAALDLIDRKHRASGVDRVAEAGELLQQHAAALAAWPPPPSEQPKRTKAKDKKKGAVVEPEQALWDIVKRTESVAQRHMKLAAELERGPKSRVYEAAVSRTKKDIERSVEQLTGPASAHASAASASTAAQAPGTTATRTIRDGDDNAAAQADTAAAGAALSAGPGGRGSGGLGGMVGVSRLEAAQRALVLLGADWVDVWAARCGFLEAMDLVQRAIARGLEEHAAPRGAGGGRDGPQSAKKRQQQEEKRRSQSSSPGTPQPQPSRRPQQALSWVQQAAKRRDFQSALHVSAALMSLLTSHVAYLQAYKSYLMATTGDAARESRDELKDKQLALLDQVAQLGREAAEIYRASPLAAAAAARSARSGSDGGGGGGAEGGGPGSQGMDLPGGGNNGGGGGGGSGGGGLLGFFHSWIGQGSQPVAPQPPSAPGGVPPPGGSGGGPDVGAGLLGRIEELVRGAQEARGQLERDAELQSVREALEAVVMGDTGMRMYGGGNGDVASYLSGHLYRCTNGHIYVVGECGNPTQSARCPQCGAAIGAQSGDQRISYDSL
ncbi:hypothetical protein GPECTOR_3g432 [Gonium pectorale]|uniref:RZ-type domain-containing protein n=1 Tax=Gonium pectorale TaxID=33097 RepID=A0A150GZE9_GONPE|nr:hypothetical protein GPECTOR_3g432 [Gonium pectorale]|eukprot:KXZ55297.1 hypothetical protein GPECTOR_3g432 [Gonium pectorale]